MYCMQCGAQNDDSDRFCLACGAPLHQQAPVPVAVPNYLVYAILCTLFCCMPFGIVAIVYAAQTQSKAQAGDLAAAQRCSAKARTWCWVSFGFGLAAVVVWLVAAVLAQVG